MSAIITKIDPRSPAEKAGLQVGEPLLTCGGRAIRDVLDYKFYTYDPNLVLEVQGECIMRLSALEEYNKTADVPLKNARNGAAGALRNLDPAVTAARKLSAYFYQVGTIDTPPYDEQTGMLAFIRAQGLPVSPYFRVANTAQEVITALKEIPI